MKYISSLRFIKAFIVLLSVIFIQFPSFALEAGKPYIKAETGFSLLAKNPNKEIYSQKPKGAPLYGIGFGYKFTDHIRGDVSILASRTYKYRGYNEEDPTDRETQNLRTSSVMLNGYYDFNSYNNFTPYITLGIGVAVNKASDFEIGEGNDRITFKGNLEKSHTWQIGSGVLYKITKNTNIDLSYKLFHSGVIFTTKQYYDHQAKKIVESKEKLRGKMLNHNFLIGIIYNF